MVKTNIKTVIVTGDVTIDWNIARLQQADDLGQSWNADDTSCAFCQPGGAAMLADIIKAIADNLKNSKQADVEIRQADIPKSPILPGDTRLHHSYAMCAPFKSEGADQKQGKLVWRVQEFLGLHSAQVNDKKASGFKKVLNDTANPDIVVLDDANLGFRDNPDLWPKALSNNSKPWIILKMARPIAQGPLWEHLTKHHSDKLIVTIPAKDLRRSQVQISYGVSWERTAQDLLWEITYNPKIQVIAHCAYLIISFDTAGAILISGKPELKQEPLLFFDPGMMEGEWEQRYKGHMVGYNSCLAASVAKEVILNTSKPDLSRAIQAGINAMRFLHKQGFGSISNETPQIDLSFPVTQITEKLADDAKILAVAKIPDPQTTSVKSGGKSIETPHFWTILESQSTVSLENVAQEIVRQGLERALAGVPIGKFGKLTTVDRREIESLHGVSNLILQYCKGHQQNPLSIAVFGPPGSGKSFAVKQVANSILPGEVKEISFNLSQFDRDDDLIDALHQVRDIALSGKMPLVFWDEFDSAMQNEPLGWLRYFLAPMQDGEFREGQISHPIGRSIFVFAGGTSHTMEEFGKNLAEEARRAVKLPDFTSRLKGFLNILGPNMLKSENAQSQTGDQYYIIRRAILLRSIFERNAPQIIGGKKIVNIDNGLLRAFLLIGDYKHGARSMETVIAMSNLIGKTSFDRSSLPPEDQLNLHLNGREFFSIMHRIETDGELLEKLARAAHEVICDELRAQGYVYGKTTQKVMKTHSSLKPYDKLPEEEKEQNRSNVKDITHKLAEIGYTLLPARGDQSARRFAKAEIEKLARMEHERWMQEKLSTGWKYAKTTNKDKKLHHCMVDWNKLPKDEQDKDRALVTEIPSIVAKAGYMIAKLH